MKEWKTYTLEEICTGKGSYGIGASAVAYDSSKYTYLRITDINDDGTLNKGEIKSVDDEEAYKYILQKNDIVFARTGNSTGRSYFYDGTDGELVYAGFLIKFSLDPSKVNPRIMKYYTHSQDYYDWVKSFDTGGTRGNINAKTYGLMPITLPPREVQDKIVEVLKSIDEKIELNKRINDNLEQQLKLLYRSWFIENKHPDSKEVCLSEIIYFQEGPGIRNWQYVEKDGIKFINIRCIEGGDINLTTANMISEEEANGKYAHFMLKPFDIIMSCSGTLGRYAIVRKEHLPLCLNTSVIRFSPNRSESDYSYIYGYFASEEFLNKQVEMACGSVQANFGPTHLKQIKIIAPPIDYCKSYHTAAMPIISKLLENRREIQHLGKLRDTLLPKLMSGELKINEIDC